MHLQFAGQIGGDIVDEAKRIGYSVGAHADVDQSRRPVELRKPRQYFQALALGGRQEAFITSATHVRLAEASLGYALEVSKHAFLRRIGVERIDIDLVGRNLFSSARTANGDVLGDALHQRVQLFQYPRTRTFTLATGVIF